ncbi:MAG: hypothetical protein IJU37_07455 [Desulfovibrio sp.]|nr:hypothetical protein [Desulfovibrio sp.]
MLKPFYQGKLDTFCAIYAVLNALRITHGIRTLKARDILNDTLMGLASAPNALRAVLDQTTDYCALVDGMLRVQARAFPLRMEQPFGPQDRPTPEQLWLCCQHWLTAEAQRAVLFRFQRFIVPDGPPASRHWTVADKVANNILHLFDCSHEAEAILNVRRDSFVTQLEDLSKERLLFIQPTTVHLLRPAY